MAFATIEQHRAYHRAYGPGWRRRNPEAARLSEVARHANAKARKYGVEGRISIEDVRLVVVGSVCVYCGTGDRVAVDHVVSMKLGGANEVANLQPCCRLCNSRKHLKDEPDAWSRRWAACVGCGTTERRHHAGGRCQRCYDAKRLEGA